MSTAHAPAEIVLGRRQLFMLPTRYGLLFALLLAVQLLAAINYGNGLAYALTFLLGSLAVVSMLYTHRNLLHLRLAARREAPVFAGEVALFRIHLINEASVPRFSVAVVCNNNEIACVDIPARGFVAVDLPVPATQRGWLAAPPISISTRFPLGLLYSWSRRVVLDQTCLVYARPAEPTAFRVSSAEGFETAQGFQKGGDDFIGVREFRPGDSPRHVDWKAAARGEVWHTKQFGGGYQATVWLDWDALQGLDAETRISVLTRWVLEAQRQGMLYGLRLPGQAFPAGNGDAHQYECLRALALFGFMS
ncbi:MAG TPA: DUF58 domain-containing protein [Candidatus Methylomirabilis sp.]|nr:DUF58 domain-containing protein [Candidatus Methylomirabilis sp.]